MGTFSDDSGTAALEPLLSIDAVADYLGVSVTTIYDWRVAGKGPRAIKVGRHLRFAVSDLMALADLDLEGRLAPSTRDLYERNMLGLVRPAFEGLRLREITVSRVDRFLKMQRAKSYSTAKQPKVILGLALGLAVRYDAMARNPVRETSRLHRPPSRAKGVVSGRRASHPCGRVGVAA